VCVLNPLQTSDLSEGALKHMLVEEHDSTKGLGLRGGSNLALHREMVQEGGNFDYTHLARVTLVVKENELAAPEAVGRQGSGTVVTASTDD
jgi:hypothetical protein